MIYINEVNCMLPHV